MAHGDNPLVTETDLVVANSAHPAQDDGDRPLAGEDWTTDEGDDWTADDEAALAEELAAMSPEMRAAVENEGDGYGQDHLFDEYAAGE